MLHCSRPMCRCRPAFLLTPFRERCDRAMRKRAWKSVFWPETCFATTEYGSGDRAKVAIFVKIAMFSRLDQGNAGLASIMRCLEQRHGQGQTAMPKLG